MLILIIKIDHCHDWLVLRLLNTTLLHVMSILCTIIIRFYHFDGFL